MIEAIGAALLVFMVGARLRPRPRARRPVESSGALVAHMANGPIGGVQQRWRRAQPRVRPGEVAAWCDSLAAQVRTGAALTQAIRSAEPPPSILDTIERVRLRLDRGSSLRDALGGNFPRHLDVAALTLTACAQHGGSAAEPLDRAAATLRARAAVVADREVHSAQARLSALVMTVLPLAMLGLILATSSASRDVMTSPIGAMVLIVGIGLNVLGWRWMRHVIGVQR